jgi:hypothetical protein
MLRAQKLNDTPQNPQHFAKPQNVEGSRLLKKPHMLRCAHIASLNVLVKYASAHRFFARLASESF